MRPLLRTFPLGVMGPRLTGSPAMKQANLWTPGKLPEWGLENVVAEATVHQLAIRDDMMPRKPAPEETATN